MKTCIKCDVVKMPDDFHKKASAKDGLMPYCKSCNARRQLERRAVDNSYYINYIKNYRPQWELRNRDKLAHKNAKRRAIKLSATPSWLSDEHVVLNEWYYGVANSLSKITGIDHHVDHIHPLQGANFSGLHVPWNLRVISAHDNMSKHNRLPPEDSHLLWGN